MPDVELSLERGKMISATRMNINRTKMIFVQIIGIRGSTLYTLRATPAEARAFAQALITEAQLSDAES